MKRVFRLSVIFTFLLALSVSGVAFAASKKAMVLPFAVNGPQGYQYLEKSIPQMFVNRLHWPDNIDAVLPENPKINTVPAGESVVRDIIKSNGLDYAVWGSVTVIGEDCSLDVRVLDKNGKIWTKSRENRVDQLIPVLSSVSDSINSEVFGRGTALAANGGAKSSVVSAPVTTQVNAAAVAAPSNTGIAQVAPVAGSLKVVASRNDDRITTQQLKISALGMETADFDGDGRDEIFMFDDHNLYVYRYENGRLVALANSLISRTLYNISLCSYDFPGIGRKLVLSTVNMDNQPRSMIIGYKDRKLQTEYAGFNVYLNVLKDAAGNEQLVAQHGDIYDIFRNNGAKVVKLEGGKLVDVKTYNLPHRFNLYNHVLVNGKKAGSDPDRFARISDLEKLEAYNLSGTKLFESSDDYSGAPVGVAKNETRVGSGDTTTEENKEFYFIPLKMPVGDFDGDGNYEIVVNKPITTLGRFFGRYRSFGECEVICMGWDGTGFSPLWKTPVLGGSVCGVAVGDLDGDGVKDLIVCLNASGDSSFSSQKTTVVGFPLKFGK